MSERIRLHRKPQTKKDKERARAMRRVWREAKPGAKVRCLADLTGWGYFASVDVPSEGAVYTIRELRRGLWDLWSVGFTLVEITNEVSPIMGSEPFFPADEFEIIAPPPRPEERPQLRLVVSNEPAEALTEEKRFSEDKWVRVMCDFTADGIWARSGGAVELDELPVSPGLRKKLRAWQDWYERYAMDGFETAPSRFDIDALSIEGLAIAKAVKAELPGWTVVYFDEAKYALTPFEMPRSPSSRAQFEYEVL